jgi:signal transduction histidine kinase/ligand-binding sensor domain-containing protein/DNA-binding response OmpR family regulator
MNYPMAEMKRLRSAKNIILMMLTMILIELSAFPDGKTNSFSFDSYTQADGLPNNQIQCIYQDRNGWIWLGTSQGLSRFDGYRFVNFIHNPEDTTSITGELVRVIFEDKRGNLIIGTENGGLNIFNREKERFYHPYKNLPQFKTREVSVNTITEDNEGNLYIGTDRGLLVIDKIGHLKDIKPQFNDQSGLFENVFIRSLQFDNSGMLWLGTSDGLFVYNLKTNIIESISLTSRHEQSREVFEIFRDDDGLLWVGTYSNGVMIVDPVSKTAKNLKLEPFKERTETIRAISKGILGDYWIGTRGGLYVYSKTKGVTDFFKHDDRDSRSLANNSVLEIFHDTRGETWIGTRGGLNLLAKSKQVFHGFSALPHDDHFLNSSSIYAFWMDSGKRIWVGTEDGGINIYDPTTGRFKYLMADDKDPNSLSQNCIKAFQEDKSGNLWIGTFWGGLDVINLSSGAITYYRHNAENQNSLSDDRVWAISMDKDGDIWVGTSVGIDRFDHETKKFRHYTNLVQNESIFWLTIDSKNNVWTGTTNEVIIYNPSSDKVVRHNEHSRCLLEDSEHRYWIATLDKGIALYGIDEGAIRYYNRQDGLSNNQALCILEDNNKNLWISTSYGLSKFDAGKGLFRNFTSRDGLRNDQFTYGAAYKSPDGELLFGGISGFNMFDPKKILSYDEHVPLVFTELRVFNKPVAISDAKDAILKTSISETSHLMLKYDQKVFTLEFTALDFINNSGNLYSYYLEGFDKGWNEPSTSRTATYTNLYPGDYTLKVKRIFQGTQANEDILMLNITVLPPFWMTWWFRSIMIILILALTWMLIKFLANREKIRNELVLEKTKARTLHELDMLKLRLFTNISHEIRTPLTLIMGPLEKLISKKVPEAEISSHLSVIFRNTQQLNRLINQLLDFRKLETGNLKLELSQEDMVTLISEAVSTFEDFAREKGIALRFHSLKKHINALFDPDKVKTIINNLVSNALKYTEPGGSVTVNLSLVFSAEDEEILVDQPDRQCIEISVKDTGKGISEKNIKRIFTRFSRIDTTKESTGTGIGLSLAKELVKLHNGNISVVSKPGMGTKFTVHLPYQTELKEDSRSESTKTDQEKSKIGNSGEPTEDINAQIMLIVEDNPDVRYFIRSHFESVYKIYEAKNGEDGWNIAEKAIPDIIISDILMPDVDGYEFCRRIKKDERTSHIPVVLLTALHSKEHEIEGLSSGADDYITKPFDIAILQTKVENILQIRRSLREKYTSEIILKPSDITISSPDERFLRKSIEVVEKNISNADLDIEQFAVEVGVSRMQLYRKFSALTNMTVKEFIRSIRLKRAAQLLLEKKLSITEIAYSVGFRDLSHFRKSFHNEFGMSASEYVRKTDQGENN